jgi:hypothetical protein
LQKSAIIVVMTERLLPIGELSTTAQAHLGELSVAHNKQLAKAALVKRMEEISDDPSGSDPADYLSPEDAETCEQFVALANTIGWPNSDEIGMRTSRIPGIPVWTSSRRTAKAGLTKFLFYPKTGATHRAYKFGKLSIMPTQAVALCDDGLLRSHRVSGIDRSLGDGWGRLPEPEYLAPVLAKGQAYGVNYTNAGSETLSQLLLGRIPREDLARGLAALQP